MDQLSSLIKGKFGKDLITLGTIDSTNTFAMELAEGGATHGTVVIADRQTSGKGRLGRAWLSPAGVNIYMSLILRPFVRPEDATLLTVIAAISCARALRDITRLPISVKWPNDLMIAERKAGGILVEIKSIGRKIVFAVVGIGINVNSDRNDFPPVLTGSATSLKIETSREQPRNLLIAGILNEIERWYDAFSGGKKKLLLDEWRNLSSTIGKTVTIKAGDEVLIGTAEDIDTSGMLLLKLPSGNIKTIHTGDLTILG